MIAVVLEMSGREEHMNVVLPRDYLEGRPVR